jgi:hypothetical protein
MPGAIPEYLDRLDQELRFKRAPRRRLLAEVEDHLRTSALELGSEEAAVERFGAAATIARRFAHAVAATSARRSAHWVALAFAAYAATATTFAATADPRFADFPQGAPTALTLQLAAVAVAVGIVRSFRWRSSLVPEDRLRLLANSAVVGAGTLSTGLALELAVALTRPAGVLPWDELVLVVALFFVTVAATAAAAISAAAAAFRSSTLAALPGTESADESRLPTIVDDLGAVLPALRRLAAAAFARPMTLAGAVAALGLCAVVVSQIAGRDFAHHASIALPALALGAFEGLLILGGYVTLGRRLGLR